MAGKPEGAHDVLRMGIAYFQSKVLLSAVELGVFTRLAQEPATEAELRAGLGLHGRAARDFLDALVALGLLRRDRGRYENTPVADTYLDERKPTYSGGFLTMLDRQFTKWGELTRLLREGGIDYPVEEEKEQHDDMHADPARLRRFMSAMDGINQFTAPALAETYDWGGRRLFADLGGARGNLAAELVKAHPRLDGIVMDLPAVRPVFEEHIDGLGLSGRVRFQGGDFFTDPLPEAEVLILGHVLHDWSPELRAMLVERAYAALPPGGELLVYDVMIDDERRENDFGLLTSLHMMLVSPGGGEYTAADCRAWMRDAGFAGTRAVRLTDVDTLVIGRKER
ncbi:methyltransferase [Actinomadura vinacea]|uniref:Methyltransferase n=1 Tax=Actinomadura vinacea TaxID=115336 RepID=A0ABN3ISX7_9ACTN